MSVKKAIQYDVSIFIGADHAIEILKNYLYSYKILNATSPRIKYKYSFSEINIDSVNEKINTFIKCNKEFNILEIKIIPVYAIIESWYKNEN